MKRTTGWLRGAILVAAMLAALGGAALAQTIADVPSSHWAYEAVQELVGKGYLALESGRFEGDRPVDRFTLATVVARILHELETGGATPQSEADVELLRKLVNEYREELVKAFSEIDASREQIGKNEENIAILEDGMSKVWDRIAELEAQIAEVDASHRAELSATASAIRMEIGALAQLIDAEGAARTELQAEVFALIEDLRQETAQASERNREGVEESLRLIQENQRQIEDAQNRVAALEEAFRSELEAHGIELGDLQGRLAQTTSHIENELSRLKAALEAEIDEQLLDARESLRRLENDVRVALAEVQSELNNQTEALLSHHIALEQQRSELEAQIAAIEERLERQGSAMTQADEELLDSLSELARSVRALETEVAAAAAIAGRLNETESRIEGVERQILAMQSQIGLSEEQVAALSESVMIELESLLQSNALVANTLERDLNSLRSEFNSYRQSTEQSLSRANQAQMFGLIGALLGIIGLVSN